MSNNNNNKDNDEKTSSSSTCQIKVRCLVQQCLTAKLQVKLADTEKHIEPEYVEVFF